MVKTPRIRQETKCQVKDSWFTKLDTDEQPVSRWLKPVKDSSTKVHCTICRTDLNCELKGFQAVSQHQKSNKHIKEFGVKYHSSQQRLTTTFIPSSSTSSDENSTSSSTVSNAPSNTIQTLTIGSTRDEVTIAEIVWTHIMVQLNSSGNSCTKIGPAFKRMFPNSYVASNFSMGKFKLSYMLTDCAGPYHRNLFLQDVKDSYYTLCFDETTNDASKNELHVDIRYYSEREKQVIQFHLETFFIENGLAETIVAYLVKALNNANLSIERMITIGRDGPNVNKKVFRLMNAKYKEATGKNLIDIGSCDLHVVHNAFKAGLDVFGSDVSDLLTNVHYFFDGEPLRSSEYRCIQTKHGKPHHRFIKHVSSRWLTLLDSIDRFIDEWAVADEYFFSHIPKKRASTVNAVVYKNISKHLKCGTFKAQLYLVKESAEILQPFLRYFQVEEPILHKIHDWLTEVLLKVLGRIAKPKTLVGITEITTALFDDTNLLNIDDIILSANISNSLSRCKDVDKSKFKLEYRKHFKAIGLHILKKSCYANGIVKCLKYISPSYILRPESGENIMKLSTFLPFNVSSTLIDEWSLLKATVDIEKQSNCKDRIDVFYTQHFNAVGIDNSLKFPALSKMSRCFLSIPHGSGDIERGFSQSSLILTEDKPQINERTLNARLNIKYGLKLFFKNDLQNMPIDKELISSAQRAYKNYTLYMEEKRRQEEMIRQKQIEDGKKQIERESLAKKMQSEKTTIQAMETVLKEKEDQTVHNARKLLDEANERLKQAIRNKNLNEISLAQGMIEGAKILVEKEENEMKEILQLKGNEKAEELAKKAARNILIGPEPILYTPQSHNRRPIVALSVKIS